LTVTGSLALVELATLEVLASELDEEFSKEEEISELDSAVDKLEEALSVAEALLSPQAHKVINGNRRNVTDLVFMIYPFYIN
jgi:HPt (histidine-containing phosphotransfer) domain-containing protein